MRKILVMILFSLLVLFLAACTGTEKEEPKDNPKEEEKQVLDTIEEDSNEMEEQESILENVEEDAELNELGDEFVAKYRVNNNWSIVPIEEGTNEKVVLLTIDDAPHNYSLEMAKTLKELNAGAIFFVNGHFIDTPEEADILKQIHDMGFIIGNHTYSHPYLPDLTEEDQKEEIISLNDTVEEIIGERPAFFRAPNGANTDYTKQITQEEKMVLMNWSYGYDWEAEYQTKEQIVDIMINSPYLGNGSNLLMHDREWTAAGLHDIVTGLREKGYEILDPHLIETIQ